MANKIRPETLVVLDIMRAKHTGEQLPVSTIKWIAEHGEPNTEEVLYKQRAIINDQNVNGRYISSVLKAIHEFGSRSPEAIHAYKLASQHKVGIRELSSLSGLDYSWIYNHIYPSREHDLYEALLKKYKNADSPEIIAYLRQLSEKGISYYKIGMWTGMKDATVRRKILFN